MIELAEYRDRQKRLAGRLGERGFAGALVVSRGGFTFDRSADVLYLTGHYQAYVNMPDNPPYWSGRAHTVYLLAADGGDRLFVSTPEYDTATIAATDIVYPRDFVGEVVAGIEDLGLGGGPLALIGADVLPTSLWRRLEAALPTVDWNDADAEIAAMRRIKSPAERDLVRATCATSRRAVTAFLEALEPGRSEAEAVGAAFNVVASEGAGVYFAAASSGETCGSYTSNPLPGYSPRTLAAGDLVRLDLGVVGNGYYSDFGRTSVVGAPTADQRRLLDTLHRALDTVIEAIRPGIAVKDLVTTGDGALRDMDVAVDGPPRANQIGAVYPVLWGHGLGLGWERPWMLPDETMEVEEAMYLTVERTLSLAGCGVAQAEQNLLVTADGVELLTGGQDGPWS